MAANMRTPFALIFVAFAAAMPRSGRTASYDFHLSISGGTLPVIAGGVNIQDGRQLVFVVQKPYLPDAIQRLSHGLPACKGSCLPADVEGRATTTIVKDGRFSIGPFAFKGEPLWPAKYLLLIYIAPDPKNTTAQQLREFTRPIYVGHIIVTLDGRSFLAP
jgi:hypothetical protein